MDSEINSIESNHTWKLVDLPSGRKAIGCRWVYKIKQDSDGNIARYKARLVAQGFTQKAGIDYTETFAPVVKFNSLRILLALAAYNDWEIDQIDFVTAFLNGEISEDIYMRQPQGYEVKGQETKVYKLIKSLYGLKQSPREWNSKLRKYFISQKFQQLQSDSAIYIRVNGNDIVIIAVYVDDSLIITNKKALADDVKNDIKKVFEIKDMGAVQYVLGLEIKRDRMERTIFLGQHKYTKDLLEKFYGTNNFHCSTPLEPGIDPYAESDKLGDEYPYREAIGSLIYLMTATRPDICFAVGLLSRFMQSPTVHHWNGVMRILKYLKGTINHSIMYNGKLKDIKLIGYCDADFAGDKNDRKSTTGYTFLINNGCVIWKSTKQSTVATSTTQAEYISLYSLTCEAMWLRQFLREIGLKQSEPTTLMCDNKSAIEIARNPKFHTRTKHFDIKYHYIREMVSNNDIKVEYVKTGEQTADILTKSLPAPVHRLHTQALGMLPNRGSVGV